MWKYLELSRTLAGLYYTQQAIIALLVDAGFNPGDFDLNGRGAAVWSLIIKHLENKGQVKKLIEQVVKEYPDNTVFDAVLKELPTPKSVYAGTGAELQWKATGTPGKNFEKITGAQNTLLPISFLEIGMKRAEAVARVVAPDSLGSGFLISNESLFLTNNHVIPTRESAADTKVQFNYQQTADKKTARFEEFAIDTSVFETSVADDWTLVKIQGDPAAKYGFLQLKTTAVEKNSFVNIIQHPGGEHKKIGMYHNLVTYRDANIIQYLTDTMPGSSGSPVFNSRWDVVALHHSGGWLEEPGTVGEVLRNEGINMNKISDAIRAKGFAI